MSPPFRAAHPHANQSLVNIGRGVPGFDHPSDGGSPGGREFRLPFRFVDHDDMQCPSLSAVKFRTLDQRTWRARAGVKLLVALVGNGSQCLQNTTFARGRLLEGTT